MTDQQWERLKDACVIMGESLDTTLQAARAAIDALAETISDFATDPVLEEKERDPFEALMRALDEVGGAIDRERLQEFAQMAEDMPPVVRKKIPRPPKRLGPANKANYTANRPPRRARSNCRFIKQ